MNKKKSQIDNLENIAVNFEKMNDEYIFMKEKLIAFNFEEEAEKVNINFRECHVAICQNGGLIAICKKKGFLDITRGSKINKYIIVMYQNAKRKYLIPIDWNYKEKWIVNLEFNEKEQLYGICNDGTIFKISILTQRAKQQSSSDIFKYQPIVKAKLLEKGFIALTIDGNFYYAKDIKNPIPKLIFPMGSLLHFSNNIEFIAIPPSKSKSNKLELLITNETGDGVIHIEETEGEGQFSLMPLEGGTGEMECKGASIIIKDKIEPYILNIEKKTETETTEKGERFEKLGRIAALALSPKKNQIAIYDPRGVIFFFYSNFEQGGERKKVILQLDQDFSSNELLEQTSILNFEDGCQFLFCGEDAVALCGYRYIFIINSLAEKKLFKISEQEKIDFKFGTVLCKCISEVDGIRCLTNEGIYFISKVSNELVEVCEPFSISTSKKLIRAYQNSLNKITNSEKLIRNIKDNLTKSIYNLLIAAANIFWTKNDDDDQEKKEAQLFLLEAAQHAKCFVKKEDFNFDKFYQMCKEIRTINNLRNHSSKPKLITYKEFQSLESNQDLILRLIRSLNFGLAFKISQYLEEDIKIVYEKYAIACIKRIENSCDTEEENKIFEQINDKLKNVKNFSFINLAKKAFKYHKDNMGMKFLDNEKSLLTKLPKYIDKEEWDKVLDLIEKIYDYSILVSILEKIFKKTTISDFIEIVGRHPNLKTYVVEFLNKKAPDNLDDYIKLIKSPEEMFFYCLEQYFQSSKIKDRENYISIARENQKLIDNNINPNFDHKFYKNYLDSLEYNIRFKLDCLNLDKPIIAKPEDISFDLSIYDTYKYGIKAEKNNWIETKNKHFNFSSEGMSILKLISYGEIGAPGRIEAMIKKSNNNLKKLSLTYLNLSEIYLNFKEYEQSAKYIKLINDSFYFEYKIDMLKYMQQLEAALEVIITNKNIENISDLIGNIIKGKPRLLRKAKEIADKNKIILNIE